MKVFCTGDTHRDISETYDRINYFKKECAKNGTAFNDDIVLIILGDFGGNFGGGLNYRDHNFKQMLEEFGINYFVIRGNHDQRPSKIFNGDTWHFEIFFDGPTFVENEFPHIHYAMDYPWIYNIEGNKTLVLPGAYSIDKNERIYWEKKDNKPGAYWFKDEQMDSAEIEYARTLCRLNNNKFDLILSHTCPASFISKYSPNLSIINPPDHTMEMFFNELEHSLEYKTWIWGHHHEDCGYNFEGHHNACLYTYIYELNYIIKNGIEGF